MRKLRFRIIVTIIFIPLLTIISLLFISDLKFNLAQSLEKKYLWQKARREYEFAVKLDPFNSEYIAGYAKFLYKTSDFEKAESLYSRAIKLNPRNAQYYVGLGKTQLRIYRESRVSPLRGQTLSLVLSNFKRAIENDPNGFLASYEVGYVGMGVWKELSKEDRELILGRLKQALKIRPWYSKYIYPRVLKSTQDLKYLQYITPENLKAQKSLYNFLVKNKLKEFAEIQKKVVDSYE